MSIKINYYFLIVLLISNVRIALSLTDTAVKVKEGYKNELVLLLKQDTSSMTPEQYAQWKKKTKEALAYIQKTFPEEAVQYEAAVEMREGSYELVQGMKAGAQQTSAAGTNDEMVENVKKAIQSFASLKEAIKKEMSTIVIGANKLPDFAPEKERIEAAEDLLVELLSFGRGSQALKAEFYAAYTPLMQELNNASIVLAQKTIEYLTTHTKGLLAEVAYAKTVVEALNKTDTGTQRYEWSALVDDHIESMLTLNDLIKEGVWQSNDLLLSALNAVPLKALSIKNGFNILINSTKKNDIPIGLFDQCVFYWTEIVKKMDQSIDQIKKDKTAQDALDVLGDYFACLYEMETLLLKHHTASLTAIDHVASQGVELLVQKYNECMQRLNTTEAAPVSDDKNEAVDALLTTLQVVSLAVEKVVKQFKVTDDHIPNFSYLYDQIDQAYTQYQALQSAKKITPAQQKEFENIHLKTIAHVDTYAVMFVNTILSSIKNDPDMARLKSWLLQLVREYGKGKKSMRELSFTNDTQVKTYTKLVEVLALLFAKGVSFEGQKTNLKHILKRANVEHAQLALLISGINDLFNSSKDVNGNVKGLVSSCIALIDELLHLSTAYMAQLPVELVRSHQQQLVPLVSLLEQLFMFENELVVVSLQELIPMTAPFSNSALLERARMLIDAANAQKFALATNASTPAGNTKTAVSVAAAPSPTQGPSAQSQNEFIKDLIETLASIEKDVAQNLKTLSLPDTIPSFAQQYTDLVEVQELYTEAKVEFTKEEKALYKKEADALLAFIDDAVVAACVDEGAFIIAKGGLFEKQLAYIAHLVVGLAKEPQKLVDLKNSKEYTDALKGAVQLKAVFQKGLAQLSALTAAALARPETKEEAARLKSHLNTLFNSGLDPKAKNVPLGLFDKLIGTWLKYLEYWKLSVKNSTQETVQRAQQYLAPAVELLQCYADCIGVTRTAIVPVLPLEAFTIDTTFVTLFKDVVDKANTASLIAPKNELSGMQQKQGPSLGQDLAVEAQKIELPAQEIQKKEEKHTEVNNAKAPSAVAKQSPVTKALEAFAQLKNSLGQPNAKIDTNTVTTIIDIHSFFETAQKIKDSFEFDSAVQSVSAGEAAQVDTVYKETVVAGVQKIVLVAKAGIDASIPLLRELIKSLSAVVKRYEADSKKAAAIKKENALITVISETKKLNELFEKTVFQMSSIKGVTTDKKIDGMDQFVTQLALVVDSTLKSGQPVGLLHQYIDEWQQLVNALLTYMKTLPVDKVIEYQKELSFLQEPFGLLDAWAKKMQAIIDGKRIVLKNSLIAAGFVSTLERITKKENAASYAKGAQKETGTVQKALISISDQLPGLK